MGAGEEGEAWAVRMVGLGVRVVHAPVEGGRCSANVAAGAARVSTGRQIVPSPGEGKGGVWTGSQ